MYTRSVRPVNYKVYIWNLIKLSNHHLFFCSKNVLTLLYGKMNRWNLSAAKSIVRSLMCVCVWKRKLTVARNKKPAFGCQIYPEIKFVELSSIPGRDTVYLIHFEHTHIQTNQPTNKTNTRLFGSSSRAPSSTI